MSGFDVSGFLRFGQKNRKVLKTRYTVRGRGAKRRTSSALPTTYLSKPLIQNNVTPADGLRQITSVQPKLVKWSVPGQGIGPMSRIQFFNFVAKRAPNVCQKRVPEQADTSC